MQIVGILMQWLISFSLTFCMTVDTLHDDMYSEPHLKLKLCIFFVCVEGWGGGWGDDLEYEYFVTFIPLDSSPQVVYKSCPQ